MFAPLAIAVLLVVLFAAYRWALPKPLPNIPYTGNAANNIFGHLPDVLKAVAKNGDMAAWFVRQTEITQSPITQIFMEPLGKPGVIVADYNEINDIYSRRGAEFDQIDPLANMFNHVAPTFQLVLKTGPEWKTHRKLIEGTMTPSFLRRISGPKLYASNARLIELWSKKSQLAGGRPFNAVDDLFQSVLDTALTVLLSTEKYNSIKAQLNNLENSPVQSPELDSTGLDEPKVFPKGPVHEAQLAILEMMESISKLLSSPLPRLHGRILRLGKLGGHIRAWYNILTEEIKKVLEARQELNLDGREHSSPKSALGSMLENETRLAETQGRQSDYFSRMIRDEVFGFISGTYDTSATNMSWAVKVLADKPVVQTRLRDDLLNAYMTACAEGRQPSFDEIVSTTIPYLDATMEEILRCMPVGAFGARMASKDTQVLGHHIPKGTVVWFCRMGPSLLTPGFAIDENLRSPQFRAARASTLAWSEDDIGEFKPERWLKTRGITNGTGGKTEGQVIFENQAGPAFGFGTGMRSCFGRRMALMQFRLFLTALLWEFELLPCPEALSSYAGKTGATQAPCSTYVRLRKLKN